MNRGPLVSEATAVPTETQPLPTVGQFVSKSLKIARYVTCELLCVTSKFHVNFVLISGLQSSNRQAVCRGPNLQGQKLKNLFWQNCWHHE